MTANGQLADNQLVWFYGVRLASHAASDAGRMVNDAAKAGHVIRPLVVKDAASGYRSDVVQAAMIYAQTHGQGADYKLLPSPPAPRLAAVGKSRHGQGRACDWVWETIAAGVWLVSHGGEYGWTFWDRAADPRHMEHDAAHDVVTWTEPDTVTASTGTPMSQEDDMTVHAIVNEEQGSTHFAWIAVVSESGELHIVDPNNRGWWNDYAASYSPALNAVSVSEQVYLTWTGANDPTTALDLDALAAKTAAKVIAGMPSDKPDLTAIEQALAGLPDAFKKSLAASLGA